MGLYQHALTSNYDTTTPYTADSTITLVDATGLSKSVSLDSGAAGHITLLGGSGNDYITNRSESSVLIDGGAGNDSINLAGGSNATVDVSKGDDTISVASGVTSFSVSGFSVGDEIQFSNGATSISVDDTSLKVGNLTIAGISKVVEDANEWKTSTGSVSYYAWKTAGASLSNGQITWQDETNHDKLFTIEGLSSTTGLSYTGGKVVTVNAEALENFKTSAGDKVTISDGYSFALGAGVSTPTKFGGSDTAWSLDAK